MLAEQGRILSPRRVHGLINCYVNQSSVLQGKAPLKIYIKRKYPPKQQNRPVCLIDPWFHSLSKCSLCYVVLTSAQLSEHPFLQMLIFLHLEASQRSALCSSLLCIWVLLPVSFLLIKQSQIFEVSCSAVFLTLEDSHSAPRWVLDVHNSSAVEFYTRMPPKPFVTAGEGAT